jgi:hypothetical protein
MLAGGCSSCDTKSRCQPGYMQMRSQSVLDAPASAYAAVPILWDRNASDFIEHSEKHSEKYQLMLTGAKRSGATAFRTSEEDRPLPT